MTAKTDSPSDVKADVVFATSTQDNNNDLLDDLEITSLWGSTGTWKSMRLLEASLEMGTESGLSRKGCICVTDCGAPNDQW